jgi:transposase
LLLEKKKDWGLPERLSLDEFSRQKGQGNFVTVVSDIDKGSLLEVKVIKEVFPNALIVIDRFHVMKLVNKALNKIRLL